MTNAEAIETLRANYPDACYEQLREAVDVAINALTAQPEKRTEERTETHACDLISRKAAIDAVYKCDDIFAGDMPVMVVKSDAYEALAQLPSVQPEIVRCKDCKHWKDSDGVYRRGIGAESKCPVNIRAVYEGNFYCADAERKTDGN